MSAISGAIEDRERAVALPRWVRELTPGAALAGLFVSLALVAVIAPSLLAPDNPDHVNLAATLQQPSLQHLFGTDQSGRDLFSRVIYGARESLLIGVGATALAMLTAISLGFAAGLAGGWIDGLINRFVEVLFALPVLLLALLFVSVFGQSAVTEAVAVGIGTAPGYTRMIRGQVLAVRGSAYVEAARALGHPYARVVRRHIFPNAMRPIVVLITLGVGQSIVWASGMAFLGLGVPPPAPEWGALLDAGRDYVTQAWWLEVMPGLVIVLFALSLTTIGRFVQRQLEGGLAR
jgi:peptide/nickel transport system permease protein